MVSRFPYPLIKGDKLRAFHQIVELSKTCDVYLGALSDEKVTDAQREALSPYCKEIRVFRLNRFLMLFHILNYVLFSKEPVQVGYFYQKSIGKKVRKWTHELKPDHIFCQLIRTAAYFRYNTEFPKTLDYMDALSAGMERRAEGASGLKKWIFSMEAKRLKKFEHQVFRDFDHTMVISASDRSLLFHYENEKIRVVPNGIDLEYFSPKNNAKDVDLLFTGNMSYPPNVQSAVYLVEKIMPLVWKKRSQTTVLISGAHPVQRIKALSNERVKIQGWTKDIRDAYSRARVFSAPMLIGSGLQNKLLEAMAMKLPCISSELANKSLGAEEDESILIGKDEDEYAHHILELLENPGRREELAEKGFNFVAEKFSWTEANKILLELIAHGRN